MKIDLFQSCGHCWVLQICWHTECSTFIASSFRIWNSSTGIPSPPQALFIVMLPKAHLTSLSRMSGSGWVVIPSLLSGSWKSFLYSSSVYSCHLFLTSSASFRSILFLSFIVPIFAWNVPLVSFIFLKRSLVFPLLFFSSISLHWFCILPNDYYWLCFSWFILGKTFLLSHSPRPHVHINLSDGLSVVQKMVGPNCSYSHHSCCTWSISCLGSCLSFPRFFPDSTHHPPIFLCSVLILLRHHLYNTTNNNWNLPAYITPLYMLEKFSFNLV